MMKKAKSKKKIVLIVLLCITVLLVIGWWAFSVSIYNENLNQRFDSYEPYMLNVGDFNGLSCSEYDFPSDKGQNLKGYLYSSGEEQHGIVVMAHGLGGGGHNSYMDVANYFAQNGYLVFAYDATGCDASEGDGVGGAPQGAVDLDHAISFVEESGHFPNLPIVLFGHSWGGYSVCSVLTYHPEVKAVIECSGANRSSDYFEAVGRQQAGGVIDTMMPFIKLHERIQYGKYASNTALDGFEASKAAVMAVHSTDDRVIPIGYGFDLYEEKYKDDSRFTFMRLENRGHNYVYDDTAYIDEFNEKFDKWLETLDYDYNAKENKDRFAADKADYIHKNLDRNKWCNMLDTEMFGKFLRFYDEHIG
ncbi:MAG: lysophospholipase [Clostridium sp.]|nr:lysophospholipase [Clostridium sp.]